MANNANTDIAIFSPTMSGGVGRVLYNLINGFKDKNYHLELLLTSSSATDYIPANLTVIDFNCYRAVKSLSKLIKYLRDKKPKVLLSAIYHTNIIAAIAVILARSQTRLVISEHIALTPELNQKNRFKKNLIKILIYFFFKRANKIVAVSQGVAKNLETFVDKDKIELIYNPVINNELSILANEPVRHRWLDNKVCPVIIGAGRLTAQKDFATLIKAFRLVREKINCKLLILGEGPQKTYLEDIIKKLGIQNDAEMTGFIRNPYPYFVKADVFVLSSIWEGFGNVLVEALFLNLPVISTNCPSGPSEILQNGALGILTPIKNEVIMSENILKVLRSPRTKTNTDDLKPFTTDLAVQKYLKILFPV